MIKSTQFLIPSNPYTLPSENVVIKPGEHHQEQDSIPFLPCFDDEDIKLYILYSFGICDEAGIPYPEHDEQNFPPFKYSLKSDRKVIRRVIDYLAQVKKLKERPIP